MLKKQKQKNNKKLVSYLKRPSNWAFFFVLTLSFLFKIREFYFYYKVNN